MCAHRAHTSEKRAPGRENVRARHRVQNENEYLVPGTYFGKLSANIMTLLYNVNILYYFNIEILNL